MGSMPSLALVFNHEFSETGSVSVFRYKPLLIKFGGLQTSGLNPVMDTAFSKGPAEYTL